MATNAVWSCHLWLVLALVCCFGIGVKSTEEEANAYQNFVNNARALVSHPFHEIGVARGGATITYLPLTPLAGGNTPVELIIAHRDLYVLGYRTVHNGERVVYLFQEVYGRVTTTLDPADYDRYESLGVGSAYGDLETEGNQNRTQATMDAATIRAGIALLAQPPNVNNRVARIRTMLHLVMVVAEAMRFTVIENRFREALRNDSSWTPSTYEAALMNKWGKLSKFIIRAFTTFGTPVTIYIPRLYQSLTVTEAMALLGVMARCFRNQNRQRRQTSEAECGPGTAIDAALADGNNRVYLFNGPNFVQVQFTPATAFNTIIGGVKSIYIDWPFLRNTPFTYGIDAGFRVPHSNNAFIFKGPWFALIDISDKRILDGPKPIDSSWPSLRPTNFVYSVDAVFANRFSNNTYMFRDIYCALVNYAPRTVDGKIVYGPDDRVPGPMSISSSFRFLRSSSFSNGFDASFALPDRPEVYLFKGDQYMVIKFAPTENSNWIMFGPQKIRNMFTSLRGTAFDV